MWCCVLFGVHGNVVEKYCSINPRIFSGSDKISGPMETTLFPSLHCWYCYLTTCSLQESGKGFRNFKKKKSTVKKDGSARAKRGSSTANKASSSSTAKRSSGAKRKRWDKEVGWWPSFFFFHNREEVTVISCFALCISSLRDTKDYATVACFPLSIWTHYNLRSKPFFVIKVIRTTQLCKLLLRDRRTGVFALCGGDG